MIIEAKFNFKNTANKEIPAIFISSRLKVLTLPDDIILSCPKKNYYQGNHYEIFCDS